jgi:hypothetical protein
MMVPMTDLGCPRPVIRPPAQFVKSFWGQVRLESRSKSKPPQGGRPGRSSLFP